MSQTPIFEPHKATYEYWWIIDGVTNEYICSESLRSMCGINSSHFTLEDYVSLLKPTHKNQVRKGIQVYDEIFKYDETYQLLTRFGYRWARSRSVDRITYEKDTLKEEWVLGYIEFLSDNEVLEAQEVKSESIKRELIQRYSSISDLLMELLHQQEIASIIPKVLKNLLETFNGDRTYLFEYNHNEKTMSCTYEFVAENVSREIDQLQQIPIEATPWWSERMLVKKQFIALEDISELPAEANTEYEALLSQSIQSILIIPLIGKTNTTTGFLGIDMVHKKHCWSDIDVQWFQSLSNIISLCIELKKGEEKAIIEKTEYARLYENIPLGFIQLKLVHNEEHRPVDYIITNLNSKAELMLKNNKHAMIGIPASKRITTTNFLKRELARYQHVLETGETITANTFIEEIGHLEYTVYAGENGEIILLLHDNTDSVNTSNELKISKKRLENIYKNIPIGIDIYDKEGNLIESNRTKNKITGFAQQISKKDRNLFQREIIPTYFLDDLKALKSSSCEFYYDSELPNGEYEKRHLILKGSVLLDEIGNVENYLIVALDNTDILRSNDKIREFELLFSSIAEFAKIGMVLWTPQTNAIYFTEQWQQNLGMKMQKSSYITDAYSNVADSDKERMIKHIEDIASGRINSFREEICVMNNGKKRWLRNYWKVTENTLTNENRIVGLNIDITGLKNTEERLIEAKQKAEQSDLLKSIFLANMSHEIRTPLNAIVGFSDLLIESTDPEERNQYIKIIHQSNDLLLALISDILDLAKIESGMVDLEKEELSLKDLCTEVVQSLERKTKEGVKLILDTPLEECQLLSDRKRVTQIYLNLINNAIKFTNQGEIRVGYQIKEKVVCCYVADTGSGIPPHLHKEVFNRFVKLNEFIPGAGLGLPICRNLVEKWGGEIWVESVPEKGSTFYFTLPYDASLIKNSRNEDGPTEKRIESVKEVKNIKNEIPLQKPLILVAEDTDSNYLLISTFLRDQYQMIRARNGIEAIQLYSTHSPKLILMDIKMPQMNGLEAIGHIREVDKNIPIIVLTAFAYDDDKTKALEAGANLYLAKPLNQKELKEGIQQLLTME
ncbi:ATP-binding protein [Porphyromonadaceae bacterium]